MEEPHLLVQEEGRAAYHAAFNVPVAEISQAVEGEHNKAASRKPPTTPRTEAKNEEGASQNRVKRKAEALAQVSRARSASTGRDKKTERILSNWTFLQSNLMRSMEDIYDSCEKSENVEHCKVILLLLEHYIKDINGLVQYLTGKWTYENTAPPGRPTSLAWEVRRTNPSKRCSIALTAIKDPTDPDQTRTWLVNYLAKELKLTRAYGLSVADIAREASVSAGLTPPARKSETEGACAGSAKVDDVRPDVAKNDKVKPEEPVAQVNTAQSGSPVLSSDTDTGISSGSEDLAKPLESDTQLEKIISSNRIQINSPEIKSVFSQTEDAENDTNLILENNAACDAEPFEAEKEEKACQTDELPSCSYTLDLEAERKTGVEITPCVPTESPAKPKTLSRVVAAKPAATVALARGTTRPIVRGRGVVNDVRPNSAQPRLLRSVPDAKFGLAARGLVRRVVEPRARPATANGAKQPSSRVNQVLSTLPNKPNIGVGRGIKKLPERVSKNTPPTRTVAMPGRDVENEINFSEQRSNSSSSINSSSSRSSWADKVRGGSNVLATTTEVRSVDDLLKRSIENIPHEDDGWKMVKVRSRSKISPVNKLETSMSRSSGNIKTEKDFKSSLRIYAQTRFHQPSAARSLPSLALNVLSTKNRETVHKKAASSKPQITKKATSNNNNSASKQIKSEKDEEVKTPSEGKNKVYKSSKFTTVSGNKSAPESQKNKLAATDKDKMLNGPDKVENEELGTESKAVLAAEVPKVVIDESAATNVENCGQKEGALSERGDSDREEEEQRKFDDLVQKTEELCAEEARLEKQIKELETEVDLDDPESELDGESVLDFGDKLHAQYRFMLKDMLPGDEQDVLEQIKELESRQPGRALELHQKLSSPSRRRNLEECLKCFQAKQAKAQKKRAQLMQEKWSKLQDLNKKIEEVRTAQMQNTEQKREQLEMKLKKAEEKRNRHLQEIARKAHDEEEKLKEIAFINELEAQNKRHDFMTQCQEQEERLQGIQEERQRKQEEKAAKEAAVEERKKILEAERQAKVEQMKEKSRRKQERIDREFQEKEKERLELAREKARDRDQRLQALQAAQLATQEELQKKIQAKQEEYARRHEENMEQIRQRALECCFLRTDVAPPLAPYDTHKLCTLCSVMIGSDVYLVSHLRGRQHQEAVKLQLGGKDVSREDLEVFSLRHITDAPASNTDKKLAMDRERQKALKKRCKKIRLRMAAKGEEYENKFKITANGDSPNSSRLQKCLRDSEKLLSSQGKGLWSDQAITSLERSLAEIGRILDKKNRQDQIQFACLNGFKPLTELFCLAMEGSPGGQTYLPAKCFVTVCNAYTLACSGNVILCCHVVLSNKISTIVDLLLHRLTNAMPARGRAAGNGGAASSNCTASGVLPVDNLSGALMRLLAMVLEVAVECTRTVNCGEEQQLAELSPRVQDVVSYAVSAGVFEKLAAYCGGVRDPIDEDQTGALFLLAALRLLRALVACARTGGTAAVRQDVSQLGATLRVTELVGGVSMLYGMLLHQGATPRGSGATPPPVPPHTVHVARATLRLLLEVAEMDLALFQGVLGAEGMSLQFRHLSSYLLWACQGGAGHADALLQDVIRLVGFFAVRNHDNQMTIQSGFTPTVLQQLCTLPFEHFMEERRTRVLLPTLLACCWDNAETRAVLEQELSFQSLEDFRLSEAGQQDSLVALLQGEDVTS